MIHSQVGKFISDSELEYIQTEKSDVGFVVYGPYIVLAKGDYSVQFDIRSPTRKFGNPVYCKIDIVINEGNDIIFEKKLRKSDLLKYDGKIDIKFSLPRDAVCEFRVWDLGVVPLLVRYERPVTAIADKITDLAPMLSPGETTRNQLFLTNLPRFRSWHGHGIAFTVSDTTIIGTYKGMKFTISSSEDFQIAEEIFLECEYNIISNRKYIAIDVGMNVGFTSLFFADNSSIIEVHSFEPFLYPYQRALQNFSLNPAHEKKITPYNFGLSDRNESLSVLSRPDSTIGTSIRGAASGSVETIEVKDVSLIFRDLISKAKIQDLDVIVKIDCEGSEFPIFESLEKNGLLESVDIYMIEWHKWWSTDKTQLNLVGPLEKRNFVVFDRTSHLNPHAAMIYAVRRS